VRQHAYGIARKSCILDYATDNWDRPDRVIGWNRSIARKRNRRIRWFVPIIPLREQLLTAAAIVRAARSHRRKSL
jgi:hypothetical protein